MGCFRSIGRYTKSVPRRCIVSFAEKANPDRTFFTALVSIRCWLFRCIDKVAGPHGVQALAFLFLARKIAIFEATRHDLE
jgi:hypothetical protein